MWNQLLPHLRRNSSLDRRICRVAWLSSGLIHGLALAAVAFSQPLAWYLLGPPVVPKSRVIEVVARMDLRERPSPDPLLEFAIERAKQPSLSPSTTATGQDRDERAQELPKPTSSDPLESLSPPSIVQRRVEQSIEQANRLAPEQKLERLSELSGELNKVSTEESLDQLTTQLQGLLGLKPRATEPAEKGAEGPFDMTTAQIHDVRRQELKEGGFLYFAILLDAAGRQQETELDEETGAQLHRTFELIKANPLLEKVYRQVVMSLLDKIIPVGDTTPMGGPPARSPNDPIPTPAPLVPPQGSADNTP